MAERLVAWLYGTAVCTLERSADYRMSMAWLPDAEARWGPGNRILSVSLPLGAPLAARDNRPLDFFENLLPEGPTLDEMAGLAGVPRVDTFGLLSQFGRDCAGAVAILPEGEHPAPASAARYVALGREDLASALRSLSSAPISPPGTDRRCRASTENSSWVGSKAGRGRGP